MKLILTQLLTLLMLNICLAQNGINCPGNPVYTNTNFTLTATSNLNNPTCTWQRGGQTIATGTSLTTQLGTEGTYNFTATCCTSGNSNTILPLQTQITSADDPGSPTIGIPPKCVWVDHPDKAGIEIMRINDGASENTFGDVHQYSRRSAFTADGKYFVTNDGRFISVTDCSVKCDIGTSSEFVLSQLDPDIAYGWSGSNFYKVNCNDINNKQLLFSAPSGQSNYTIGRWEGQQDFNDKYILLEYGGTAIILNLQTGATGSTLNLSNVPGVFNWADVSSNGTYALVGTDAGVYRFNTPNFTNQTKLNITNRTGNYHFDMMHDALGNEIMVMTGVGAPSSATQDWAYNILATNQYLTVDALVGPEITAQSHVSGQAKNRPGWMYVSGTNKTYPNNYIFSIEMKPGNNQVECWGSTYSSVNPSYKAEPKASVSPNGDMVVVSTNWNNNGGLIYEILYRTKNFVSQQCETFSCSLTVIEESDNQNCQTNGMPFENVVIQNSVSWNAGNANANRPKPALGVWEPGDVPGTEIMRVSDAAGNGLHFYNSRQTWNADMTKLMIGNGVLDKNRLLDATNNYAVLPTRVNLNSDRVWSNTNPDLIYGMSGPSNFYVLNVTTGVRTLLYARPGGTQIGIRTKGNLPGDDSKIALYESSTNRIISFDIQTRSVIAEIVWPHGNVNDGGNYVSYDWTGNWIIVGMGTGSDNLYRTKPNLTDIQLVHNNVEHFDQAYNTNGESVQVQTRGNGSVQVINFDDPSKNYISPIFGGADPNQWPRYTPDYISGRGQNGAPGWVAFGGESTAGSPNHPLGLYRVDGNTSTATIKVIGYDHHSSAPAISAGGNDDRQKPSVSPDGNQVIFTSDWGLPNGALSSYIIRGIQTNTPCNIDAPIGCPTGVVADGNISIEEPLPAGGASWLSSSPFWSCTQNGNAFDVTQYIVPPNPNAFTLNGLPAADYCCNFEGIPLDANGNQLPTIYNQCCFTVDSDNIDDNCNSTVYVGDPLTSNYHRAGTINSDATIPQNTLVEFIVSIAVNLLNGFTIEQDGELSIGFEDCDDPIACPDSRYVTHTVLNTTNTSIQLKMETAQNMPLRLIYYPTANPSVIQYQTCEYSYLYGANGNEHVQTISGLNAATEYTIIIQTSADVVSSQSECPNMNWEDISCPFLITTNDN